MPIAASASLWLYGRVGIAAEHAPDRSGLIKISAIVLQPIASWPRKHVWHPLGRLLKGLFPGLPCVKSAARYRTFRRHQRADPINIASIFGTQKSALETLQMTFGGYTVVPDPDWSAMYRVRGLDGTLTDMVNLTRARDAARCFADQERRQELKEAA